MGKNLKWIWRDLSKVGERIEKEIRERRREVWKEERRERKMRRERGKKERGEREWLREKNR